MVTKEWASIHRKHHAKVETDEDPHSPVAKGIKNHSKNIVKIALVGKYFSTGDFVLNDAYLSVF